MELLKLIPQFFYDLIARVIPGSVALLSLTSTLGHNLGDLLTAPLQSAPALTNSWFFLATTTFLGSYLVGQALSPLSDLFERELVARLFPHYL